jgi:DNA-binding NarL/FixJ family response regulator
LTARELEVARLVAEGKSNREIAEQLFISARTAQTHVTNILTKLGLESRAALAAYVVRQDLG